MGFDDERAPVHGAVPNLVVSFPLTCSTTTRLSEDANEISLVVSHESVLRLDLPFATQVRSCIAHIAHASKKAYSVRIRWINARTIGLIEDWMRAQGSRASQFTGAIGPGLILVG